MKKTFAGLAELNLQVLGLSFRRRISDLCAGSQFTGAGSEVEGTGSETRLDPAERKPCIETALNFPYIIINTPVQ